MEVSLNKIATLKGEDLAVCLKHPAIGLYEQVQLEIYDTKVLNPSAKLGFGTLPDKKEDGSYEVTFSTNHLPIGIYEVKNVILRTRKDQSTELDRVDFLSGRDFQKLYFEVVGSENEPKSVAEIAKEVLSFATEYEKKRH